MLPCLVVLIKSLRFFIVHSQVFPVEELPILANRAYFDTEAAREDISFG
jgi:hypothetical protein